MIVSKYGADNLGWWSKRSLYGKGFGCWKSTHVRLDFFKSLVCFGARNGSRVLSWHDKCCREPPLSVQFPNLFRMACARDAIVHE